MAGVIDLSYAAAYRIGIAQKGSGEVEVEAIIPGETVLVTTAPLPPVALAPAAAAPAGRPGPKSARRCRSRLPTAASPCSSARSRAMRTRRISSRHLANQLAPLGVEPRIRQVNRLFRVFVGPYPTREIRETDGRQAARCARTPVDDRDVLELTWKQGPCARGRVRGAGRMSRSSRRNGFLGQHGGRGTRDRFAHRARYNCRNRRTNSSRDAVVATRPSTANLPRTTCSASPARPDVCRVRLAGGFARARATHHRDRRRRRHCDSDLSRPLRKRIELAARHHRHRRRRPDAKRSFPDGRRRRHFAAAGRAEDVRAADFRARGADAVVVGSMRPLGEGARRGQVRAGRRRAASQLASMNYVVTPRRSSARPRTRSPTSSTRR